MSIYFAVDEDEPEFLASNSGWSDVIHWADTLDVHKYPDLIHLIEHGWDDTPAECAKQLIRAIKQSPSKNLTLKPTLNLLLTLLQSTDKDAVVLITNGMS